MRTAILLATATFALAACGSGPKSEDQVMAEAAKLETPKPGQYRTSMKITKFEIPMMTAKQSEEMKGVFSATGQSSLSCISPEQAKQGYREQVKKMAQGKCTYDKFEASGGMLDAKLTCETGRGMTSVVEMAGKIGPERTEMHLKMRQGLQAGANAMGPGMMGNATIEMDVTSERIGDCPA
jgi:hypothetical protein